MTAEDRPELERLVGGPIVHVEHAEWGFTNRTDLVTLTDGSQVVVQRYASRLGAAHRLQITAALTEPLASAGVRIPRVIRAALDGAPPYALLEVLPGELPHTAAGAELSSPVFAPIAVAMGELVRQVAAVPTTGLRLPGLWAAPDRLVRAVGRWLDEVGPALTGRERNAITAHAVSLPEQFAGRPTVLAHGDFGPTNVLVRDGRITGVLDWEFARLADPLFDVAWWDWVLRFHYRAPESTWDLFAAAAGVDPLDPPTARRISTLQVLRTLEATVHFGDRGRRARAGWTDRVRHALAE